MTPVEALAVEIPEYLNFIRPHAKTLGDLWRVGDFGKTKKNVVRRSYILWMVIGRSQDFVNKEPEFYEALCALIPMLEEEYSEAVIKETIAEAEKEAKYKPTPEALAFINKYKNPEPIKESLESRIERLEQKVVLLEQLNGARGTFTHILPSIQRKFGPKLTAKKAVDIFERRHTTRPIDLAIEYGVTVPHIYHIWSRRSWAKATKKCK